MKLSTSLVVALLSLTISTLAHADRGYHCGYHHYCHGDDDDGIVELLLSLYTTTTTDSPYDDRAVYLQNVQDDAAAYIAGGDESALLQEAINSLRTEKGVTGSDAEIATALISE